MKKFFIICMCVCISLFVVSCQDEDKKAEINLFAMDTTMEITAYGAKSEEAIKAAEKEIYRLEKILAASDDSSQVGKINKRGHGKYNEDLSYLIDKSTNLYEDTNGAFNILVYPLMKKWGFIDDQYNVHSNTQISKLLKLTDMSKIKNNPQKREIEFNLNGMEMDFGGIAKGYASSQVMKIFDKYKIKSGIVNLGGNVHTKGCKPDGSKWKIGIKDPKNVENYIGVLETKDMAVITSGGYERYFEKDGKRYHHILNPKTGKPVEGDLASVTIVSNDGALADGLSTSLFVMGEKKAIDYWKANKEKFDVILVKEDGSLIITKGIEDAFSSETKNVKIVN